MSIFPLSIAVCISLSHLDLLSRSRGHTTAQAFAIVCYVREIVVNVDYLSLLFFMFLLKWSFIILICCCCFCHHSSSHSKPSLVLSAWSLSSSLLPFLYFCVAQILASMSRAEGTANEGSQQESAWNILVSIVCFPCKRKEKPMRNIRIFFLCSWCFVSVSDMQPTEFSRSRQLTQSCTCSSTLSFTCWQLEWRSCYEQRSCYTITWNGKRPRNCPYFVILVH